MRAVWRWLRRYWVALAVAAAGLLGFLLRRPSKPTPPPTPAEDLDQAARSVHVVAEAAELEADRAVRAAEKAESDTTEIEAETVAERLRDVARRLREGKP